MRKTFKASKIKKLEKLIVRRLWDIVDNDMEAKEETGQRKHFSASFTIIFTLITAYCLRSQALSKECKLSL